METSTVMRGRFFKQLLTNARKVTQLTDTLKQKVQSKDQIFRRYGKRETQYINSKMFKEDTNKFHKNLGKKNIEARETPSMAKSSFTGNHCGGRKSTAQ
jgi:ribosomal protein S2